MRDFTTNLNKSEGIAVDSLNNLYVANFGGKNVLKFNSNTGELVQTIRRSNSTFIDVAVDSRDNLYALDCANKQVVKYDSRGNLLTSWSSLEFPPVHIDIDSKDNVYVWELFTLNKYFPNGTLAQSFQMHFVYAGMRIDKSTDTIYVCDWLKECSSYDTNGNIISNLSMKAEVLAFSPSICTFYGIVDDAILIYNESFTFTPAPSPSVSPSPSSSPTPSTQPTATPSYDPNCFYKVPDCFMCLKNPLIVDKKIVDVTCQERGNKWVWVFRSLTEDPIKNNYYNTITGDGNIVDGEFFQGSTGSIAFYVDPANNCHSRLNVTGCIWLQGIVQIIVKSPPSRSGTYSYLTIPYRCAQATPQVFATVRVAASYSGSPCDVYNGTATATDEGVLVTINASLGVKCSVNSLSIIVAILAVILVLLVIIVIVILVRRRKQNAQSQGQLAPMQIQEETEESTN